MKTKIFFGFLLSFLLFKISVVSGYENVFGFCDTVSTKFSTSIFDSSNIDYLQFLPNEIIADTSLSISDNSDDGSYTSIINEVPQNQLMQTYEQSVSYYNLYNFTYAGSPRYTLSGEMPDTISHVNLQRSVFMGMVVVAGTYLLHQNQNVAWWDGKLRSFHIREDGNYALYADKCGHFMGGYFVSYFARESFLYTGVSWNKSILYGSLFGLALQTYVEVKDGFAKNTGFSPSDLAADIGGVVFFYLQNKKPVLQNFSPKWQYSPPDWIGVPQKARTHTFLDNYNATTAWISINVKNLVWENQNSYWPKWLNIAVGYGINGYYTSHKTARYVVGLDLNMVELLPEGPPLWNWLKQSLNCVKIPTPALEFTSDGTRFRIFYPFTISLGTFQF